MADLMITDKILTFIFRKKLIVSEPWNYSHPKFGDNQISGTVLFSSQSQFFASSLPTKNVQTRLATSKKYDINLIIKSEFPKIINHKWQIM